jgi:hypothetical protein
MLALLLVNVFSIFVFYYVTKSREAKVVFWALLGTLV